MSQNIYVGLAAVIVAGILSEWIAWRFRIPSILVLLLCGFAVGPLTGILSPDQLFGILLFPIVSFSVAIILFEGGMNLKFKELARVGRVVRNLMSLGILTTWFLTTFAAHLILRMDLSLSLLLGAILVVTGPTVIGPLLRQIRPKSQVASILKWEGIIIDPVGAILSVLVFEAILSGSLHRAIPQSAVDLIQTLFIGGALGMIGAGIIIFPMRRFWLPDFLQSPLSLMVIVVIFTLSNRFQAESGLLAATVMGIVLANQDAIMVRKILEFKENLRVLLISSMFILLAARFRMSDFAALDARTFLFLGVLLVVIRPAAVWISTVNAKLHWKERLFLSWIAPRGIVAAAVSSVFAYELVKTGYPDARQLVTTTFMVIIGTVSIYSITSPWLARRLSISIPDPQGLLIAGAHPWARAIARALKEEGIQVFLVDSNYENISSARMEGLSARHGNILSEALSDESDLEGVGRFLALTSNDEVNSLAAAHFARQFGSADVYQLPPRKQKESPKANPKKSVHFKGRFLFDPKAHFDFLDSFFRLGGSVKKTLLTKEFTYEVFQSHYGHKAVPLCLITAGKLTLATADKPLSPKPDQILISFTPPKTSALT